MADGHILPRQWYSTSISEGRLLPDEYYSTSIPDGWEYFQRLVLVHDVYGSPDWVHLTGCN